MKIKTLFIGPCLTQSGYGVHARQIIKSILKDDIFDLYVENITWGNCSFVTENNEDVKTIKNLIQKRNSVGDKNDWDLLIHLSIPNEWSRKAKFNVGVTAGIETDRVSHIWIQKANEMDMVIVPSEHSKKVFLDTVVEFRNEKTGEQGSFKLSKPIHVCPEGVDTAIFNPEAKSENSVNKILDDVVSDFNFLCVGMWGKGGFKEDRKNIAITVKYFIDTFIGEKDIGLIIKTSKGRNTVSDYELCKKCLEEIKSNYKQDDLPPIYLLHGNLTEKEMAALYTHPKVKALISLTHGEGFGLPMLEASSCALPVVATNWSGHLDFLNKGKFSAIKYDMVQIPKVAAWKDILIEESGWAEINEQDAKHRMKKIVNSYMLPKEWAKELSEVIQDDFSCSIVGKKIIETVKSGCFLKLSEQLEPIQFLDGFVDDKDAYNVLYTMPMSSGDVFVSTAVISGLKKILPENSNIYFATDKKYAPILLGNKDVYKVIPWSQIMMDIDICEQIFDLVLTPNTETHFMFSNWIRRGQGKLLAEQYAAHCQCELGEYFIEKDDSVNDNINFKDYITFHPGSGNGQWEARKYVDWQEVINNLKQLYPELKIIQVGSQDESKFENIDLDMKGKTSPQQLASIISKSKLHLCIDTFTMHLAAAFYTPIVALFGSSHAKSTGPWVPDKKMSKFILLESSSRKNKCSKACYKYQCKYDKDMPCINEIDSAEIVQACARLLDEKTGGIFKQNEEFKFNRIYPKISGYTTVYNCENLNIPYIESIKSMLGFCDEVVILDGCSNDGTYEKLEELQKQDGRVKLYQNEFDMTEPAIDGMQKAFARALCENEYLWQQDADEIVHEKDYEKIKIITKRFPKEADILHLPIVELWGDEKHFTGRKHSWKWRMSRNKPEITHGINQHARLINEKTGKLYAKKGMSDGCEYVHVMTNEMIKHTGFYNAKIEEIRRFDQLQYCQVMNEIFEAIPSVYHTSWMDLESKINQLKKGGMWDKLWNLLYQEEMKDRFPGVETEEQMEKTIQELKQLGGENSDPIKYVCELKFDIPKLLREWIDRNKK